MAYFYGMRSSAFYAAILTAFVLFPLLAFQPFLSSGFTSDDFYFCFNRIDLSWSLLTAPWDHQISEGIDLFRPLTFLSYELNHRLLGSAPSDFRVVNYLLHSLTSFSIFVLMRTLKLSRASSLAVAALFLVQPVHHENLFWISGRTFSLAAVFYLLSLSLFALSLGAKHPLLLPLGSGILALLAFLSYEGALSLAAAAPITALYRARLSEDSVSVRRCFGSYAPILIAVLLYFALRWAIVPGTGAGMTTMAFSFLPMNLFGGILFLFFVPSSGGIEAVQWIAFFLAALLLYLSFSQSLQDRAVRWGAFLGAGIGLAAFSPFLFYFSFSERFLYLASLGLPVCLCVSLEGGAGTHLKKLIAGVILLLFLAWAVQLNSLGTQWKEAGRIAHLMARELHEALPENSPPPVHVFEVPAEFGRAYLYPHYLNLAVKNLYGRNELLLEQSGEAAAKQDLEAREALIFRWDGEREKLIELTPLAQPEQP